MDGAGPFLLIALVVGLVVAGCVAGFSSLRWWLAALAGLIAGDAAFVVWIPREAMAEWAVHFAPFVAGPALAGAVFGKLIRKKVLK